MRQEPSNHGWEEREAARDEAERKAEDERDEAKERLASAILGKSKGDYEAVRTDLLCIMHYEMFRKLQNEVFRELLQ